MWVRGPTTGLRTPPSVAPTSDRRRPKVPMSDKLIELHATVLARLTLGTEEKGQGTLEYVGIVIVAGILVGAVVDALAGGGVIKTALMSEIRAILGRGQT